jgi:hypothetical protein
MAANIFEGLAHTYSIRHPPGVKQKTEGISLNPRERGGKAKEGT